MNASGPVGLGRFLIGVLARKYSLTAKSSYDFIQYLDTSSLTENALKSVQRYEFIAECPSRAKRT